MSRASVHDPKANAEYAEDAEDAERATAFLKEQFTRKELCWHSSPLRPPRPTPFAAAPTVWNRMDEPTSSLQIVSDPIPLPATRGPHVP